MTPATVSPSPAAPDPKARAASRGSRRALVAGGVVVVVLAGVVLAALLLGRGGVTPSAALGAPRFVEETATAGLVHTYDGGTTFSTGGGIAILDCDEDGLPDAYVAGGANPAALFHNESTVGGALRFRAVPAPETDLTGVTGAYPLDIDGDGSVDLAVLRIGETALLRNLGGCRFERANERWGFTAPTGWTTAFSATWEGTAALPTLALGSYVTLDAAGDPTFDCGANALYRPAAHGDAYDTPIPLEPGFCTLSMLFSAWDGSTRRDLRVTNDRHYSSAAVEQLWRMDPGMPPRAYTADDGWVSMQIWGMGIASQDITGDGLPEVYLTSQGDNRLQTLLNGPAQPTYRDIALKRGVNAAVPFTGGDALPSTAWHPEFEDVNNDGFLDLFVSKGNVSAEPDFATRDPSNLFLGQPDGTYREGADEAGVLNDARARGASLADLNLDGLPDLVLVNLGEPVRLWRNAGAGNAAAAAPMCAWIGVHVGQPGPNRDAIGAVVEVKVGDAIVSREIVVGGGHIGGRLGPIHAGLGSSGRAEVRVIWPDGEAGPWLPVEANRIVDVQRGADAARPWVPGAPASGG